MLFPVVRTAWRIVGEDAPGPIPRPVGAERWLRRRGDRPGFEPLDPGVVPAPDRAPPRRAELLPVRGRRLVAWTGTAWDGSPADAVTATLGAGLGDALRGLPLLGALARAAHVGRVRAVVRHSPAHAAFLGSVVRAMGVEVVPAPLPGDAWLPDIHLVPDQRWRRPPAAPLVALVAAASGLPCAALAAGVLPPDEEASAGVLTMLEAGGWRGEPLVALQADVLPPSAGDWRAAKFGLAAWSAAGLLAAGARVRPVLVGGGGAPAAAPGVLDARAFDVRALSALLRRADLVVAGDSAPLHLAALHGTPTLAWFGPTDPDIHVTAAGTVVIVPEGACPILPCGRGSFHGPAMVGDRHRVPLPCPPEGACAPRLSPVGLAATIERLVAGLFAGRRCPKGG